MEYAIYLDFRSVTLLEFALRESDWLVLPSYRLNSFRVNGLKHSLSSVFVKFTAIVTSGLTVRTIIDND